MAGIDTTWSLLFLYMLVVLWMTYRANKKLAFDLDEERSTLVVVECAVKKDCVAVINRLMAENERLKNE